MKLPAETRSSLHLHAWPTAYCPGALAQLEAQAAPEPQIEPFTKPWAENR